MSHQEIVIQQKTFSAPAPYHAGHVLLANEAAVLNQTLAENLRNNFAAQMKKAGEEGRELTQHDFDAYAAKYAFGVRATRTVTRDPVGAEERKLAAAAVRKALKKKNINVKDVPDDTFEAYVAAAVATGKFRAEAEAISAARAANDVELDFE